MNSSCDFHALSSIAVTGCISCGNSQKEVRMSRSHFKTMFICLRAFVHFDLLNNCKQTMNQHYMLRQHDALAVRFFLVKREKAKLNYPPYPPDLSSCDFWEFIARLKIFTCSYWIIQNERERREITKKNISYVCFSSVFFYLLSRKGRKV